MTARLDKFAVAELSEKQRALYDAIAGGPRSRGRTLFELTDDSGRLEGPFNAMLLSPALGSPLQALGSAVRYGSSFTDRSREIAILVVAHAWDSPFEIYAHEAVARAAGLDDLELALLREGRQAELTDPVDRMVGVTAGELAGSGDLDDDAFATAADLLGRPMLFELTTLVGYYALLALQLRVFRVSTP